MAQISLMIISLLELLVLFKLSVLAPVNQHMNITSEEIPPIEDELSWMELNLRINSGFDKPVKNCPVCCKEFKTEHGYFF